MCSVEQIPPTQTRTADEISVDGISQRLIPGMLQACRAIALSATSPRRFRSSASL